MSLSVTIVILNQFFLRSTVGLAINAAFVHVTKKNMDNYFYLKVICAVTSLLPFFYMFKLIPTLNEAKEIQKKSAEEVHKEQQEEKEEWTIAIYDLLEFW